MTKSRTEAVIYWHGGEVRVAFHSGEITVSLGDKYSPIASIHIDTQDQLVELGRALLNAGEGKL